MSEAIMALIRLLFSSSVQNINHKGKVIDGVFNTL